MQSNGTPLMWGDNGTETTPSLKDLERMSMELRRAARVEENLQLRKRNKSIAQTPANRISEERQELTISQSHALDVAKSLPHQNTASNNIVQELVVEGVKRKRMPNAVVYNLHVYKCHEYLANGILVHNCLDAIRYGIFSHMVRMGWIEGESEVINTD